MANKEFKTRVQHKHDTQENWEKATGFAPLEGEFIIYNSSNANVSPQLKIGDGTSNVNDLPFFKPEMDGLIFPESYGAKGDGVTNDSAAIQAAINAATTMATKNSNGTVILQPIVYLAAKQYKINTGLIFETAHSQFICDGELIYSGTDAAIAIKNSSCNIYVNQIEAASGTAVLITSADHQVVTNNITVNRVNSSVVGLHVLENSSKQTYHCISYNKIRIYTINASGTGVLLEENGITWLTENWFFLGSIGGGASIGIKIILINGREIGSSRFFHGGLEGLADDAVGIWLENTGHNTFEDFRAAENYGNTLVKFVGNCINNDIATSLVPLGGIDISEMTGGYENILRGDTATGAPYSGGYGCGTFATVSYKHGITYDPLYADIHVSLDSGNFTSGEIGTITTNGVEIPTSFDVSSALADGSIYKLSAIYSAYGSMARGFPLAFSFPISGGKIKLNDCLDESIIDNTSGAYAGKIISVKWIGYDKLSKKNIWDINVLGTVFEDVSNKTAELTSASTDNQYPTAKAVYDAIKEIEGEAPNLSIDENGHLVLTPNDAYTNVVPTSTDTSGAIYNGVGYKEGYRLSSSSGESSAIGSVMSGYFAFSVGGFVQTNGISWGGTNNSGNWIDAYIMFYDSSFNYVGHYNSANAKGGVVSSCSVATGDDGKLMITPEFKDGANVSYARVSGFGSGSAFVVTVNEEIAAAETEDLGKVVPAKGTDYYTEADKTEMVNQVKAALTTETWTFTLEDGSTVTKAVYVG